MHTFGHTTVIQHTATHLAIHAVWCGAADVQNSVVQIHTCIHLATHALLCGELCVLCPVVQIYTHNKPYMPKKVVHRTL